MRYRAGFLTLSLAVAVGVVAQPTQAQAWCRAGITEWSSPGTARILGVDTSWPSSWRSPTAAVLRSWNVSGSSFRYNTTPQYTGGWRLYKFRGNRYNTTSSGLTSAPGIAYGSTTTPTHDQTEVIFNTDWSWNTSGVMNQSRKQVDYHTVAVHEIGHATGLGHPYASSGCGTPTTAEKNSVMYVDWRVKRTPNSDDRAGVAAMY